MDEKVANALRSTPADANKALHDIVVSVKNARTRQGKAQEPAAATVLGLSSYVADGTMPARTRRWAAVVLLCFAHQWEKVRIFLYDSTKGLHSLGKIVLLENQELRLLCACIISTIITTPDKLESIWSKGSYPSLDPSMFPLDLKSTSWCERLDEFVLKAGLGEADVPNCVTTFGVHLFEVVMADSDTRIYHHAADRNLRCIVGDQITVTFAPTCGREPFFLDIPYSMVLHLEVHRNLAQEIRTNTEAIVASLKIHLIDQVENFVLNARKRSGRIITLFFEDDVLLGDAHKAILSAWGKRQELPSQVADILICSQQQHDEMRRRQKSRLPAILGSPELCLDVGLLNAETPPVHLHRVIGNIHKPRLDVFKNLSHSVRLNEEAVRETKHISESSLSLGKDVIAAGTLARLTSALSPEPDEPATALLATGLDKLMPMSKNNGMPWASFSGASTEALNAIRVQSVTRPKVSKKKIVARQQSRRKETPSDKTIADGEDKAIFDVPASDASGDETAKKELMKNAKRKPQTNAKRNKKKMTGQTRGTQNRANIDGDEYQPSQPLHKIPESTNALSRSRITRDRHAESPYVSPVSRAELPEASGMSLEAQMIDIREPHEKAPPNTLVEQTLSTCRSDVQRAAEVGTADFDTFQEAAIDCIRPQSPEANMVELKDNGDITLTHQIRLEWTAQNHMDIERPTPSCVNNRQLSLIDESSVRKPKVVSFGKKGPKNQGRRSKQRNSKTLAFKVDKELVLIPSDPPRPDQTHSKDVNEDSSISSGLARQNINVAAEPLVAGSLHKRHHQKSSSQPRVKRLKLFPGIVDGDGFMPIGNFDGVTARFAGNEQQSRRASLSVVRTQITDEGSPIPLFTNRAAAELDHIAMNQSSCSREMSSIALNTLWADVPRNLLETGCAGEKQQTSVLNESGQEEPLGDSSIFHGAMNVENSSKRLQRMLTSSSPESFESKPIVTRTLLKPAELLNPFDENDGSEYRGSGFVQRLLGEAGLGCSNQKLQGVGAVCEDGMDVDPESSTESDEVDELTRIAELEWDAALQPRHHRMIDLLCRISRHFVGHIVECESAIEDEVENYYRAGSEILRRFDRKHLAQLQRGKSASENNEGATMSASQAATLTRLAAEKQKVGNRTHELLKVWHKGLDTGEVQVGILEALAV